MTRKAVLTLILAALGAAAAPAQGWAEKMFADGLSHDFGVVPHGAQLYHRFTLTNLYAVRMEITSITPGCGCVTATTSKRVLEPRETATLDVNMDATRFTGPKTVVVRVTVGPEFTSSAEIKVSAVSRADVVINPPPGQLAFGVVGRGQAPAQTVDVEYAGALDWQVSEVVVGKDQPFEAKATELYRKPGRVGYQIKATLKADAPTGALRETLHLKTNDPASPLLPILVTGEVQSVLTASPAGLDLGTVKVGAMVTKRVVLRGSKSFQVLGVDGLNDAIALGAEPGPAAAVQTLTFKCQFKEAGGFKHELKIKTDAQDDPVTVVVEGTAAP
jgi:hypothetical protein